VRHYRTGLLPRVLTSKRTTLPPDVPVRVHLARLPGSESGACFAQTGSPWPTPFPPSPPLALWSRCSATSSVVRSCPTSHARSSLAYVLRLPSAASLGRAWDLPVPAYGVSVHAQGLRPRRVFRHLALAMPSVWSSVLSHYVDTLIFNRISRLNTWPARTPVNASAAALLLPPHDSGPVWLATPSPYGSLIHYTSPVFPALSGHPIIPLSSIFSSDVISGSSGCPGF